MWLLLVLFLMRLLFSLLTKWRNWFHFSTTFMSLSYAQQKNYTNTHNLVHARTYTLTKMNEKSKNCKQTMVVVPFYFVLLSSHWWFPMESRDTNVSRDWRDELNVWREKWQNFRQHFCTTYWRLTLNFSSVFRLISSGKNVGRYCFRTQHWLWYQFCTNSFLH